jgi:hypothetical protein
MKSVLSAVRSLADKTLFIVVAAAELTERP